MYRRLHDYAAILGFVTGFLGAVLAVELVPVAEETEVPAVVAAADDAALAPPADETYSRFSFAQGLEASVLEPAAPLVLAEAVREALPEPVEALPAEPAAEPVAIAQLPEKPEIISPRDDVVAVASAYSSEAPQVDPVAYTAIAGWSYAEAPQEHRDDPILLRLPASAREEADSAVDDRTAARSQRSRRAEPTASAQRTASRKIEAIWDHSLPKSRGACYWNLVGELSFICVD
jgi:hypothetical protein